MFFDKTFSKPLKDSNEAMYEAGLNWRVSKEPLFLQDQSQAHGAYATIREDTGQQLGIVGSRYAVLQNKNAFSFADETIKGTDAHYIGAGEFDDGKTVYLVAKMTPNPVYVTKGDPVEQYITLINNHSGDMRPMAIFSPLRLVCKNMLAALKRYATIKFSHTKGGLDRMKEAEAEWHEMIKVYAMTLERYKFLATVSASSEMVNNFVEKMFPIPEDMVRPGGIMNSREMVMQLFESGMGSDLKSRGSYWNLYNAYTEYYDHHHGRESSRLKSGLIGQHAEKKSRALEVVSEYARAAA